MHLPTPLSLLTSDYSFQNKWVFQSPTAFLNPAIITTIKTGLFNSSTALGNQHREAYVSSLAERPDEKEFTIPLVALAVTSVCLSYPLCL